MSVLSLSLCFNFILLLLWIEMVQEADFVFVTGTIHDPAFVPVRRLSVIHQDESENVPLMSSLSPSPGFNERMIVFRNVRYVFSAHHGRFVALPHLPAFRADELKQRLQCGLSSLEHTRLLTHYGRNLIQYVVCFCFLLLFLSFFSCLSIFCVLLALCVPFPIPLGRGTRRTKKKSKLVFEKLTCQSSKHKDRERLRHADCFLQ